uniref:Uncharacterized protein n=1 Tax=Arundo donax TaxID=35708 RepID=A0A0A8ZP94_ARUDO
MVLARGLLISMRSYPCIVLWRYSNPSSLCLQTPPMLGLVYPCLLPLFTLSARLNILLYTGASRGLRCIFPNHLNRC